MGPRGFPMDWSKAMPGFARGARPQRLLSLPLLVVVLAAGMVGREGT